MDCRSTQLELIAYHLGALPPEQGADLEDHLCQCGSCLKNYMLLKREMDRGTRFTGSGAVPATPSAAARARLRQAVQNKFEKSLASRAKRFFFIPVPLYQAAALLFFVAAAVFSYKVFTPAGSGKGAPRAVFNRTHSSESKSSAENEGGRQPRATAFDGSDSVPESSNYL